jgi:hypothetical protein
VNEIKALDTEQEEQESAPQKPPRNPNLLYIIAAAVLLTVIVVAAILLITQGIPALLGDKEPTTATEIEPDATAVATFTPRPTREATHTPVPPAPPALVPAAMSDTDTPRFDHESAGARPSEEWTGFFGNILDTDGNPVAAVPVIVWYRDGQPASDPVLTDQDGYYEIVLAEAPLAGMWTIQLLAEDGHAASKLFSFQTDENTEAGIQQIQVIWREIP